MSKIKLLPEHLIDQIKAGEIIERPANLLKELIENSIDAKANHIKLHLIDSGLELLHIEDNGIGMSFEDLPLAFHRHATSKLTTFNDLFHLSTYGFRGEALASAAAIAKVKCETSEAKGKIHLIQIEGGQTLLHHSEKEQKKAGTSLFIKNMFFNTPARLKFVQSLSQEKNQIKKIIHAFLLSNPHIHFELKWDDKDKTDFLPTTTLERFANILKVEPKFIQFKTNEYNETKVSLYFNTDLSKNRNIQYIFVNNRYVQHKQLHAIMTNHFSQLGLSPQTDYLLFIQAPADKIDVNIHPNKIQVKFIHHNEVLSLLSSLFQKKNEIKNSPFLSQETEVSPSLQRDTFTPPDVQYLRPMAQSHQSLSYNISHYTLIHHEGVHLLIDLPKLLTFHMNQLQIIDKNIIPLLVSFPLKTNLDQINNQHPFLSSLGFEIDSLSPQLSLIRSFDKSFTHFQLDHLIYFIINQEEFHFEQIKEHIPQLVKNYPLDIILEKKIAKIITENMLKGLMNET